MPLRTGRTITKWIANSRLIAFENSGHALFLEECQKFNDELIKFIKDSSSVKNFKPAAAGEFVV